MTKLKNSVVGTIAMGVLLMPGIAAANDKQPTASSATFGVVKAKCAKAIADRQSKLDELAAKVVQSPDPHDAELNAIITTSRSGLIALQAAIEANTGDLARLKQDCERVITDLRIYALRVPQINLVMSIDKFDAAMAKLATLHDELLTKLADMLATATAKIDGIDVAGLLAITPASYNADKKVLRPYLQSVRSVRADLEKASQFAKQ
jgi:hypothetical protein